MNSLRLDWCSYAAARHACENWHYSGRMPCGKTVKVGVWEDGRFIGAVVFSRGASHHLLTRYGLTQAEGCELTRVALRDHRALVTRIVAIALRMLKRHCPGLRLVVSFADPARGHVGAIYQAGNWLYSGTSKQDMFFRIGGRITHPRCGWARAVLLDPKAERVRVPRKHRYLYPFDQQMRARIEPLAKPYPKRAKATGDREPPGPGRCDSDPHAPPNEAHE